MLVLGIESSCDETGIALYDTEHGLLSHALHSQIEMHSEYGGVVPELASRDHIRRALPLIQNSKFKTEQLIAQLNVQGAKGLPAVWDLLKTNQVDAQKIADLTTTLAANTFLKEKLSTYDQASIAQKTVLLTYGSGRQWPEVKSLVWRAVQSNHSERAAGFEALTYWVEWKDFDLIAEKLSIAQLPNEVKALQSCMTQLIKQDGSRNSKITAFALAAPNKINWVPFVQEVANLDWLYALGKKNEEATRTEIVDAGDG